MKKAYTASSLKRALENFVNNDEIQVKKSDVDLLKCPILNEYPYQSIERCYGNPIGCHRARYQACQRIIRIYMKGETKFALMIVARFTISANDSDGYVEKNDQTLRWLIDNKRIISECDLVTVEV